MQTFTRAMNVALSVIAGSVLITWVMLVHFGLLAGVDFWSALTVWSFFDINGYSVETAFLWSVMTGCVFGLLLGLIVFVITIPGRASSTYKPSTHADFMYSDSYSDSSSDGGSSD